MRKKDLKYTVAIKKELRAVGRKEQILQRVDMTGLLFGMTVGFEILHFN